MLSSILPPKIDFCTIDELFMFVFLGELKRPKRHFEINWPLNILISDWLMLYSSMFQYNDYHRQRSKNCWDVCLEAYWFRYCSLLVFQQNSLVSTVLITIQTGLFSQKTNCVYFVHSSPNIQKTWIFTQSVQIIRIELSKGQIKP